MTTLSVTVNRRHLQSDGQLSIHLKQGNRVNDYTIAVSEIENDYQLTLLGVIIALKSVDHSDPLTITTDNEAVASIGQWITSDADCDMLQEDVEAWRRHQEVWQRLFSLLPESVFFHYRGDRTKRARRSASLDTAAGIVEMINELCLGGTVVIVRTSSGGKR